MRIGVDKTSIFNWEARTASPNLRALPGVIRFLGYDPTETGSTLGERLRATRRRLGLSHADLARQLGVDPSTILDWEKGRRKPARVCGDLIRWFLEEAAGGEHLSISYCDLTEAPGARLSRRPQGCRRGLSPPCDP